MPHPHSLGSSVAWHICLVLPHRCPSSGPSTAGARLGRRAAQARLYILNYRWIAYREAASIKFRAIAENERKS